MEYSTPEMPGIARHAVYLSDRSVMVIDHALRAYAEFMKIQMVAPSPREAEDIVKTHALIQGHRVCKCPTEGGTL
jgi:hypothetical protein